MPVTGSGLWLCGRVWTDGWRPQLVPQVCEGILNTHGHDNKSQTMQSGELSCTVTTARSTDSNLTGNPSDCLPVRLRVFGYQRFDEPVSKMTLNSCGGVPTEMGP
jgi:hypothetical protein